MTRSNRSIQCAPLRVAISRNAVSVALALVVITLAPPALAAPPVKHAVVNASSGNPSTTAYQSARATCPPPEERREVLYRLEPRMKSAASIATAASTVGCGGVPSWLIVNSAAPTTVVTPITINRVEMA